MANRPAWRSKAGFAAQLLGALLVVSSLALAVFSSHAGATTLSNNIVTVRVASSGAVADNPLSNGEAVDISVASNTILNRSSLETAGYPSGAIPIKVLECADRDGQSANLPTKPNDCDPSTIVSTADQQADGSLLVKGFTVYSLPDPAVLGASNGTMCDASHECVVGIFADQNDFSKPHVFSSPFLVTSATTPAGDASSSGSDTPGTSLNSNATTASSSASARASDLPAALANTGGPTLWPFLLGAGAALLIGGTGIRLSRRWT